MMHYKKLLPFFLLAVCFGVIACGPNAEELNTRGEEKFKNEDIDGALADFNKAIEKDPKYTEAYLNRGYVYITTGELQKVLTNFDKAIALDSGCVEAYYNRGVIYDYFEEYDKSIADFNKVIELNPKDVEAYINRALIYSKLGNKEGELANLKEAARLGDPAARNRLEKSGVEWIEEGAMPDLGADTEEQKTE